MFSNEAILIQHTKKMIYIKKENQLCIQMFYNHKQNLIII